LTALETDILAAQVTLLLVGFAYAAVSDLRTREVTDRLWQVLGVGGLLLGLGAVAPGGALPVVLWILVGVLVLEHMVPWDEWLGSRFERFANAVDLAAYVGVAGVLGLAVARFGLGASGVPVPVVAVYVVVVFARVLFEAGVLYGAADAKAIMVAGVVLPIVSVTLLPIPSTAEHGLALLPFAFNVLMNAAVAAVAVPVAIALMNVRRGEFRGLRAFTGYTIPVGELPHRFVWVRDPTFAPKDEAEPETSEEDQALRTEIARELEAKGVERVWVTPQLPFVVLIAVGSVLALLAGNLVLDLLAVL